MKISIPFYPIIVGLTLLTTLYSCQPKIEQVTFKGPIVIGTWNVPEATTAAYKVLTSGGTAIDAVEAGCRLEEANEQGQSIGKGGLPDRDGQVTLDACIMDSHGNSGAVVYLKDIVHAVSVARKVMEETTHVMLAGDGAKKFAIEQGFPIENLLTEKSKADWEKWKETSLYKPIINIENHDTIGMLAMDEDGNFSGACTTSGLAYKMAGRVGDSPIIGAGLYVDNAVGAATATGLGEEIVKNVGSFLIVELMRQGKSPQDACEIAVQRIVNRAGDKAKDFQVGFVALNKKGEFGSFAIHEGFSLTKHDASGNANIPSPSYY